MKPYLKDICFVCVFISVVLIYIIYFCIEHNETSTESMRNRTLETDGFLVFFLDQYEKAVDEVLKNAALKHLPPDYQFLDYSYAIKNATLSTFHRDVTSSQSIYGSKHPIYTLILYRYEGCLLSICPGSNYTAPFVYSQIVNISGPTGTCFLFNSEILHAGCFNHCKDRDIIQYKIAHKDDLDSLQHLQDVHVEKEEFNCEDSLYNHFLRKCSYFFELPINTIFNPLLQKKHDNGVLAKLQDYSSVQFYNNI
jgi:hypothetical protein